jgi:hypothetical protein
MISDLLFSVLLESRKIVDHQTEIAHVFEELVESRLLDRIANAQLDDLLVKTLSG